MSDGLDSHSRRYLSLNFSEALGWSRPKGVIDDVFSVPPGLVQNLLKTHRLQLRLISPKALLNTYT